MSCETWCEDIPDDWNSGESGLRNRAGGDRANKDHLLSRLGWGVRGRDSPEWVWCPDDHVSCYIMCCVPCVPCATLSRVCLNYLTGWQRARSYDMDQAQTRISPRVPIHWTGGRNNTKLCAWMILYKFWGSRSCENRGWRDERDMLWPLLLGRGAHNAWHPGHLTGEISESYWDNKGRAVINLGNKTQWSRGDIWHLHPAIRLCPLHFIVAGSVSIISCPVSSDTWLWPGTRGTQEKLQLNP